MTNPVLVLDPGLMSGAAYLKPTNTGVELVGAWQIPGGAEGLHEWLYWEDTDLWLLEDGADLVVEKFNARQMSNFSYTTKALEPLRCEGVLVPFTADLDVETHWVSPNQQYIAGGKNKADKKKRQHRMLKDLGFYRTGKDFGTPDADDFRSALAHGLGYLIRSGHEPSYRLVSQWNEENE